MLSDRGSFSCFFRHSTEAAPSFLYEVLGNATLYEVLGNATLYEVLGNANPQPAKKSWLGKL